MVTHDRYFLDKVSNRILEISHGKMYSYDSNYSRFLELKAEREEMNSPLNGTPEHPAHGTRMGETRLPRKKHKTARQTRTSRSTQNGTAPTADAVVEMDAVETRMGKKTIEFHSKSAKPSAIKR